MQYDPQTDLMPAHDASAHHPRNLPTKSTVILIRWPVVLISCSLILFRTQALPLSALFDVLLGLYAFSNVGLYFIKESTFRDVKFQRFAYRSG